MAVKNAKLHDFKYDNEIVFSIAPNRAAGEGEWKQAKTPWSTFVLTFQNKASSRPYTREQYDKMSRADKTKWKDIGGYTGSILKDGRRTNQNLEAKTLITLDLDDMCTPRHVERVSEVYSSFAYIMHSTHSHLPTDPRIRLIFPLARPVSPDEYEALARLVADMLDINAFDPSTFRPAQLMFFPTHPKDIEYVFDFNDAPWINPDELLKSYEDWTNRESWPTAINEDKIVLRAIKKAKEGAQLDKPGNIGVFNRTYSISEAIQYFLPTVYLASKKQEGVYTYFDASTTDGFKVYEDDTVGYSYHASDKVKGAVNAFDMVRIHLFGDLDIGDYTSITQHPSYKEMMDFVYNDERCRVEIDKVRVEKTNEHIAKLIGENAEDLNDDKKDKDWKNELEPLMRNGQDVVRNNKPIYVNSLLNIKTILENDPFLKPPIGKYNLLSHKSERSKDFPWDSVFPEFNDTDVTRLRTYLESAYGIKAKDDIRLIALEIIEKNSYHPIREKLESLTWDNVPRAATLFIDTLGVDDTEYSRNITLSQLVAAVMRVYKPGCKWDYILMIQGDQGIGKSTLLKKLAFNNSDWFLDSINNLQDTKAAAEQLQGKWIVEFGEMAAFFKTTANQYKNFLTNEVDSYRPSYGKQSLDFPRQCIFIGTTNEDSFLNDPTGNRRFLIFESDKDKIKTNVWDLDEEYIEQVWAEVFKLYKSGFDAAGTVEKYKLQAEELQKQYNKPNDYQDLVNSYVTTPIPISNNFDFENWSLVEKQLYYKAIDEKSREAFVRQKYPGATPFTWGYRKTYSAIQFWIEYSSIGYPIKQNETRAINEALKNVPNIITDMRFKWDKSYQPKIKIEGKTYRPQGILKLNLDDDLPF